MEEIRTLQEELRKQKNLMIILQQKMQKNQEAWADTILMCQADVPKLTQVLWIKVYIVKIYITSTFSLTVYFTINYYMHMTETQTEEDMDLLEEQSMEDTMNLLEDELKGSASEDEWHGDCDKLYDEFGDDDVMQSHGK